MRIKSNMTSRQFIEVTKALADPTRFELLQMIARRGETACGELVRQFPLAQVTISRHLKILTEASLVEVRRESQFNYYRMLHDVLDQSHQALDAALRGRLVRRDLPQFDRRPYDYEAAVPARDDVGRVHGKHPEKSGSLQGEV